MIKKFLSALVLVVTIVSITNGQNAVDEIFNRYGSDSEFRMINVSSAMFKLMAKSEKAEADPALTDLISKLDGMRVLVKDEAGSDFHASILPTISEGYDELMTIHEDGEDVKMFIRDGESHVEQFLAVVHSQDQCVLIDLQGEIDLQNIGKLAESLDAPGLKYLSRVKK